MKGYRFYRDCGEQGAQAFRRHYAKTGVFASQNSTQGNVIAVFLDEGTNNPAWYPMLSYTPGDVRYQAECLAAVFDHPNSPVASTSVSLDYLSENCIRVSEKVARSIHPAMFERLDAAEDTGSDDYDVVVDGGSL